MVGGAILAAWIPFWTFLSGLSTIDFMRTSSGRPSIGTFGVPPSISAGFTVAGICAMVWAFVLLSRSRSGVVPVLSEVEPTTGLKQQVSDLKAKLAGVATYDKGIHAENLKLIDRTYAL